MGHDEKNTERIEKKKSDDCMTLGKSFSGRGVSWEIEHQRTRRGGLSRRMKEGQIIKLGQLCRGQEKKRQKKGGGCAIVCQLR